MAVIVVFVDDCMLLDLRLIAQLVEILDEADDSVRIDAKQSLIDESELCLRCWSDNGSYEELSSWYRWIHGSDEESDGGVVAKQRSETESEAAMIGVSQHKAPAVALRPGYLEGVASDKAQHKGRASSTLAPLGGRAGSG